MLLSMISNVMVDDADGRCHYFILLAILVDGFTCITNCTTDCTFYMDFMMMTLELLHTRFTKKKEEGSQASFWFDDRCLMLNRADSKDRLLDLDSNKDQ